METLETLCINGGIIKFCSHCERYCGDSTKKSTESPYDPAILLLYICPKEVKAGTWTNICITVFTAGLFMHKSKNVEATKVSIDRWMGKQDVTYTYNGILFSFKK